MNFNILVAIGNFMFFFAALAAYAVLFTESDGGEHAIDSITLATPFLVVLPLNFLIGDLIASRKWLRAYKWLSLLAMICIAGEAVYIICNFSIAMFKWSVFKYYLGYFVLMSPNFGGCT